MNIILLIIDTMRYDYLGANGNDWIETPNLDRLAAESLNFDRAYASSFPTIPHRTDVMTGRWGSPFHHWMPLPFDWPTLPRLLADGGYATQLIHDTPHLVNGGHNFDWPFHAWSFVRGAEVDRSWIDDSDAWPENWNRDPLLDGLAPEADSHWAHLPTYLRVNRRRRAAGDWNCMRLFDTAAAFLRDNARRRNFFLWLDCFDPHEPWDAPPEFVLKYDRTPGYDGRIDPRLFKLRNHPNLPEAGRSRVAAHYAAKVSWVDHCLGRMLEAFAETGLTRNTALVVTADHGTRVGEGGRFGKGAPVNEQEAHVPLLVRLPEGPRGRSDRLVQPQDLFPTLLALGGCPVPAGAAGHDLLAAGDGTTPARSVALAGVSANAWERSDVLFTVFDGTWYLLAGRSTEGSELRRAGSIEPVQEQHPDVARRLYEAGLEELARRGTDPRLMNWVSRGGNGPLPRDCPLHAGWPPPPAYTQYFSRLYLGK